MARPRRVLMASISVLTCLIVYSKVSKPSAEPPTAYKHLAVDLKDRIFFNRPLDLTSSDDRETRLRRAKNACAAGAPEGNTMNILVYSGMSARASVSYCVVPKAGCTFWIRMFRFLNNDTGGVAVRTPFDIDRTLVHDASRRTMKMYRLQNPQDKLFIVNTTRFMFVRDPYSRVWSAYVDKLILPNLWTTVGRQIARRRTSPSSHSLVCGNDVTFQEFVEYIVHQSKTEGPVYVNGHWRPIQYVCDLCKFRPHFIGKQETFMADTKFILNNMGLKDLLSGYDRVAYIHDEVSLLADYNFRLLPTLPAQCASTNRLVQLLWAVFQLNGHLVSSGNDTAWNLVDGMNRDAFKRLVFSEQEKHWEEIQATAGTRRRHALAGAFRALPGDLLDKFLALYHWDFEYFGYEKRPKDIFV